jgi:hypothetical protein
MTTTTATRETSTWRALGFTDEITACDHCGREDLKGTVRMVLVDQDGNEDGEQFMGVVCAARMTGRKATEIRTEAARAEKAHRDAARAEFVAWQDAWSAVKRPLTERILARLGVERSPRAMRAVHEDAEYVAVATAWDAANPRPTAYDAMCTVVAPRRPRRERAATFDENGQGDLLSLL